ncbi:nucleotidyltransferase domain-containing protein [Methanothermobacter sp. CaT2]|uniref:type VII toxin-antitoxin system MntA family adenylyltransferase antitoxin n=1 Tax=Methanothermobacter sp. CaT2 TaxID=866790 RepID=UPI00064E867E|nr:nucleotidyltransferase domain-containing protein [Methanothermobacter sp. CaT2]
MEIKVFEKLVEFFVEKEEVDLAYLFGSTSRGDKGKLGDFDIGVLLQEPPQEHGRLQFHLKLLDDLVSLLKADKVDLIIMNDAPLSLNYNIIKEGILLKDDEEKRIRFEKNIMSEYLDRKYYMDRHARIAINGIARQGLI